VSIYIKFTVCQENVPKTQAGASIFLSISEGQIEYNTAIKGSFAEGKIFEFLDY